MRQSSVKYMLAKVFSVENVKSLKNCFIITSKNLGDLCKENVRLKKLYLPRKSQFLSLNNLLFTKTKRSRKIVDTRHAFLIW